MKINSNQLREHLKRQPLRPAYLVSSNEPLLVQEACDLIRAHTRDQGYLERECLNVEPSFDWHRLNTAANTLSLFSTKRLVELRIPNSKPGTQGAKAIEYYLNDPPEDKILLIITGKIEAAQQKSRWFRSIEKDGLIVQIYPINAMQLPSWISQRLKAIGLSVTHEGSQFLAERVEGNLLAAQQEIEKLRLLFEPGHIDAHHLSEAVSDHARYDVFKLVDAAMQGNAARTIKILSALKADGTQPTLVLWSLARELRSLANMRLVVDEGHAIDHVMQKYHVWNVRQAQTRRALQHHDQRKLFALLQRASSIDCMIKGAKKGNVWDALTQLALGLAGKDLL